MRELGLLEAIKARYSCRTFTGQPLSNADRSKIIELIDQSSVGLFDNKVTLKLIASEPGDADSLKGLGTYGFIKKPSGFIVGSISEAPMYLEDFGYCMEKIILTATGIGLGTCWLGGTFKKSRFAERIYAGKDVEIPAVVAIGYLTGKKTIREKLTRTAAGADKRKSVHELFFSNDLKELDGEFYNSSWGIVLEMVRLAPSASNKQPWRIMVGNSVGDFHLFLERTKGYDLRRYGLSDLQRVDAGIAMCHFDLVARELGLEGSWTKVTLSGLKIKAEWEYIASWKQSEMFLSNRP
jgi:hypothetical protein